MLNENRLFQMNKLNRERTVLQQNENKEKEEVENNCRKIQTIKLFSLFFSIFFDFIGKIVHLSCATQFEMFPHKSAKRDKIYRRWIIRHGT